MLGNESSMLILILRTKVPGNFRSLEQKFQGTKVSEDECSRERKFNESSQVRKFHESFLDPKSYK